MLPELSVIVCTYNQAGYLRKALTSLSGQTLPPNSFEVLVIDNGSSDDTREVAEAFRHIKHLRFIRDPVLGLSHARNTGWRAARGRLVAYMDDDAVASPHWAERILRRFHDFSPRPGSVGGKVTPIWEAKRPQWLTRELERHLSLVDWMDAPMRLEDGGLYLAGTNVSYRRDLLEQSGGFRTNLGRKGPLLRGNEELWMQRYLHRRQASLWYDPEILVQHHIKAQRLTPSWFFSRFYWQGVSDALLEAQTARWDGKKSPGLARLNDEMRQTVRKFVHSLQCLSADSGGILERCRFQQALGRLLADFRIVLGLLSLSEESVPAYFPCGHEDLSRSKLR